MKDQNSIHDQLYACTEPAKPYGFDFWNFDVKAFFPLINTADLQKFCSEYKEKVVECWNSWHSKLSNPDLLQKAVRNRVEAFDYSMKTACSTGFEKHSQCLDGIRDVMTDYFSSRDSAMSESIQKIEQRAKTMVAMENILHDQICITLKDTFVGAFKLIKQYCPRLTGRWFNRCMESYSQPIIESYECELHMHWTMILIYFAIAATGTGICASFTYICYRHIRRIIRENKKLHLTFFDAKSNQKTRRLSFTSKGMNKHLTWRATSRTTKVSHSDTSDMSEYSEDDEEARPSTEQPNETNVPEQPSKVSNQTAQPNNKPKWGLGRKTKTQSKVEPTTKGQTMNEAKPKLKNKPKLFNKKNS